MPDFQTAASSQSPLQLAILSTNYRAEASALLYATEMLNSCEELSTNSVILTDCRSVQQSLQTEEAQSDHTRHQTDSGISSSSTTYQI